MRENVWESELGRERDCGRARKWESVEESVGVHGRVLESFGERERVGERGRECRRA